MFNREPPLYRPAAPSDPAGLVFAEGTEQNGVILAGKVRSPSGETYEVKNGYLDLLKNRAGADNAANLTNFLPGAGRGYEPLWRVHSLGLLTGETFLQRARAGIISELAGVERGGRYLDLGCSAGLYTRNLAPGDGGEVIGIDISPSMLKEAARRARGVGARPSFARAGRPQSSVRRCQLLRGRLRRHPQRARGPGARPARDTRAFSNREDVSPSWVSCVPGPFAGGVSSASSPQAASGSSSPTSKKHARPRGLPSLKHYKRTAQSFAGATRRG